MSIIVKTQESFFNQDKVKSLQIIEKNYDFSMGPGIINCYKHFFNFIRHDKILKNYKFWLLGYTANWILSDVYKYYKLEWHKKMTPLNLYGSVGKITIQTGQDIKICKIMELDWDNFLEALDLSRIYRRSFIIGTKREGIESKESLKELYKIALSEGKPLPLVETKSLVNFVNTAKMLAGYSDFILRGRGMSNSYIEIITDESILPIFDGLLLKKT